MTLLSVNVNKVATLRNARGGDVPNLKQVTADLLKFGAQGITVHPRPDERHITRQDVNDIRPIVHKFNDDNGTSWEFNMEGFPTEEFLDLVQDVQPEQVTLVPDPPDVITSNAGWDCVHNREFLLPIVERLQKQGSRVSLFVDVNDATPDFVDAVKDTGADRVELYTEAYARDPKNEIEAYVNASQLFVEKGIELNAGHDLSLDNIQFLIDKIPHIKEVSIGHALISEALYLGFEKTIQSYLEKLRVHAH